MEPLKTFDMVALTVDLPGKGLRKGQVGTIVEQHTPTDFEVEFSDNNGVAYALLALPAAQLMRLHFEPALQAA